MTPNQIKDQEEHLAAITKLGGMPKGNKSNKQTPGFVLCGLASFRTNNKAINHETKHAAKSLGWK